MDMTMPPPFDSDSQNYGTSNSPYLPHQMSDPGIPHKWRRPSIRERGLIIAILVLAILNSCTISFATDDNSDVRSAVREVLYEEGLGTGALLETDGDNWSNGSSMFPGSATFRTDVYAVPAEGGTILYSVVTNNGRQIVPIIGLEVDNVPGGGQATYISGALSIAPGDSKAVAVWLEGVDTVTQEQIDQVSFSSFVAAGASYIVFDDVSPADGEDHLAAIRSAYEPIVKKQLATFTAQK